LRLLLACVLCAFAFQATAAAHVLDEYVEAAQVSLARDGVRVELRLVPGVEVADRVFALIDSDSDGQISSAEEQAYARRVMQDITLEVDGRRAPLALTGVEFPSRREMKEGDAAIRLRLAAEAELGAAGEHRLSFRNDHLPELGVYLVNAMVPATSEIKLGAQERDPLQRELRLSFRVAPADTRGPLPWVGVLVLCTCLALLLPLWRRMRRRLTMP
jgi:hypothetical protein